MSNVFGVGSFVTQRSASVAHLVIGRIRLLGAGWVREELTATRLHDSAAGRYYWGPYDAIVNSERRAGLHVLGLLDYSNTWGLGDHGTMPHTAIRKLCRDFARYAYDVARHFRGRVSAWQVWNEPNLRMFWHPTPNPADYARLLATAYRAIKRADRHAQVVMAGTSGMDLSFIRDVIRHTRSFDVLAVQPYRTLPETRLLQQILWLRSFHKPVWFTEIGWAAGDGCDACTSEADQAAYLIRFYALAAAAGVQRVFWYDLRDDARDPLSPEAHFGLLQYDLAGKPAFVAFTELSRLLGHAYFEGGRGSGRRGLYVLRFRTHWGPLAVMWNTGPDAQRATIPWPADSAFAVATGGRTLDWLAALARRLQYAVPPGGVPMYLVSREPPRLTLPGPLLHLAPPVRRVVPHPPERQARHGRARRGTSNKAAWALPAHHAGRRSPARHRRHEGAIRRRLPRRKATRTPSPTPTATATPTASAAPSPTWTAVPEATVPPTATATPLP